MEGGVSGGIAHVLAGAADTAVVRSVVEGRAGCRVCQVLSSAANFAESSGRHVRVGTGIADAALVLGVVEVSGRGLVGADLSYRTRFASSSG